MDARTKRALIARLNRDAEQLAGAFGLHYRAIEAERANVKRRYGVCYSDGTIRIRLRHATTGRPLKYSSLVNTLCHELAHLRHFDHGPRFKRLYLRILEHARALGLYRPARAPAAAPAAPLLAGSAAGAGAGPRAARSPRAKAQPPGPRRTSPSPEHRAPAPLQLDLFG